MPSDQFVCLSSEEQELAIGGTHRGETGSGKPPLFHPCRIGLQPNQCGKWLKGHKEKVAKRDHHFLRPGSRDLIGPNGEKIGMRPGCMGKCRPDTGIAVNCIRIREQKVRAARIGGL